VAAELRHHDLVTVPTLDDGARIVVKGALGPAEANTKADARTADAAAPLRELTVAIPYVEGETVRGAILRAGGLAPWADLANAWVEHSGGAAAQAERARMNQAPDRVVGGANTAGVRLASTNGSEASAQTGSVEQQPGEGPRTSIDLRPVFLENDLAKDVKLLPGDTVYVPPARTDVAVSGHVMKPGLYGYSMRLTAGDYLALAGGETREGARGRAKVVSADGKSRSLDDAGRLTPGDSIVVPGKVLTTAEWVTIAIGTVSVGISAAVLGVTISRF
jgi:protein involved in polysaccharide export with SLBB domain